jgi:hypothetical protein
MKSWFYSIGIDYDFQKRRKEEKKTNLRLKLNKNICKITKTILFYTRKIER